MQACSYCRRPPHYDAQRQRRGLVVFQGRSIKPGFWAVQKSAHYEAGETVQRFPGLCSALRLGMECIALSAIST